MLDTLAHFFAALSFRQAIWLFPPTFALHVLEEVPGFTAWVRRYASPHYTQRNFIRDNGLGLLMGLLFCALLSFYSHPWLVFLFFVLCAAQSLVNILFHLGTTAAFRAYSPGLITALLPYPPLFYYLARLAVQEGLLGTAGVLWATVLAAALHAGVVAKTVFFARTA